MMKKISTRDFGEIEVNEKDIYEFPSGIFAFEDTRKYALISPLGENIYPMWLQCIESVTPCFIVFDPSVIDANYKYTLSGEEKKLLKVNDDTKIRLLSIAKVPDDFKKTTVNMKSPIIINDDERLAAQIILPEDYSFRLEIYGDSKEGA